MQLPPGSRERAYVTRTGATTRAESLGGKGRDDDLLMRISSRKSGYVFAHELGHIFGVEDEYHEQQGGGSALNTVAVDDLLSGRGPDLMAQTWSTNGVFPVVQARHVETMLKQYNVAPPVAAATTAPAAPSSSPTLAPSPTASAAASVTAPPATTTAPPTTSPPTTSPPTTSPPTAAPPTTRPPTAAPPTPAPPTSAPPTAAPPTPQPTPAPTVAPTPAPTLTTTISPARDLTGTWRGGIASTGHYQGQVTCKWTGSATLQLTQNGNALAGQAQLSFQTSQAVLAGADCTAGSEQYGVTGTVSSSSVTFTFTGGEGGWYGTARGSFTTDLMSGTFAGSGEDYGTGCFQLSRTGVGALPSCAQ
jgi:hypothetical protein